MENATSLSNVTDDKSVPGISVEDTMAKIYIAVGTFGMAGNLLVIGIILSSPNMRKMLTNKYIVNQSFIDFLCSMFLLLGFATVKDSSVPYKGWKGDVYCLVCKLLFIIYVLFYIHTICKILLRLVPHVFSTSGVICLHSYVTFSQVTETLLKTKEK